MEEVKKEQADTESNMREISQGMKVRRPATCKIRLKEDRIFNIVPQYETYVEDNDILPYLIAVGFILHHFLTPFEKIYGFQNLEFGTFFLSNFWN